MIDVCLPGTGGMMPLPRRWLTCCWIEYQGSAVLIDCGEGTQIAIKKAGLKPSRIELLLLTHYHADHVSGLPGILLTLANIPRTEPLTIAGPPGLKRIVSALTVITPRLPFELNLIELDKDDPEPIRKCGLDISALPLKHGVTCFGYRAELFRKPVFNPEKAAALQISVQKYKVLHAGGTVTLEDGRVILPEQVLDGARQPISVCYFTDTRPFPQMSEFAQGVDLLISEGMYYDESMRASMADKNHMLFSDSAKIAANANAKRLWLTHYSPALDYPPNGARTLEKWFKDGVVSKDGEFVTLEG